MAPLEYERLYAEAVKGVEGERKTTPPHRQSSQNTSADLHSQYERKSATRAAKAVGASGRSVAQAKAVARDHVPVDEQAAASPQVGKCPARTRGGHDPQVLSSQHLPESGPYARGPRVDFTA